MSELRLEVTDLSKRFHQQVVFQGISFQLEQGQSLVITGPNGSGKSTLIKLLLGLLAPSRGKIQYYRDGVPLSAEALRPHLGFVAPYLQLYGSLTGMENLYFLSRLRGQKLSAQQLQQALEWVGLAGEGHKLVRAYSSGMQQRLKYALAMVHQPTLVMVDEPTANLDREGKQRVYQWLQACKGRSLLVVATNEEEEIALGEKRIALG